MTESSEQTRIKEIESSIDKIQGEMKLLENRIKALKNLEVRSPRAKEAKRLSLEAMDGKYRKLYALLSDLGAELEFEWVKAHSGEDYVEPPIEDKIYE